MKRTIIEMKESPAVIEHIKIMQNVISRMADQSAKCKNWCITLLAALLVLPLQHGIHGKKVNLICVGIAVLFFLIDSYYLGIERAVRKRYYDFLTKLNNGDNIEKDLFEMESKQCSWRYLCQQVKNTVVGMDSVSTGGFYGLLILGLWFVYYRLSA